MKKSTLILCICLLLSVALGVGSTLAYLTDRDAETNVFTIGSVDIELEEDFEQGSTLIPGVDIEKKPVITNTGDNDAWVWLTFSVPSALDNFVQGTEQGSNENVIHWNPTGATTEGYVNQNRVDKAIEQGLLPEGTTAADILASNKTWNVFNSLAEGKNAYQEEINGVEYNTYVLLYNKALEPGETTLPSIYKVFLDARVDIDPEGNMAFVQDGNVTELDWNINEDGAHIIYAAAYAVQKEGFDTVKDAYDAYSEQWGDNGQAEFVQPVNVATVEELKAAMANAEPGDIIVLADGEYDLEGSVPFAEGVTLVGGTNTKILYPAGRAVTGSLKDVKISNLTIDAANPFRYCYADGDVVIENCTIVGTTYGIHFDGGTGKVIVKGCEVEGWNSFGRTLESVTFEDCYFTKGNYGCLRFYQDALLKNCTFAEDFSWIDSGCDDISITIEDCTYEKEDGKIYDIIFNYGDFSNVIWTVDDMIVANVGTH